MGGWNRLVDDFCIWECKTQCMRLCLWPSTWSASGQFEGILEWAMNVHIHTGIHNGVWAVWVFAVHSYGSWAYTGFYFRLRRDKAGKNIDFSCCDQFGDFGLVYSFNMCSFKLLQRKRWKYTLRCLFYYILFTCGSKFRPNLPRS